jgi:hypothetical protein
MNRLGFSWLFLGLAWVCAGALVRRNVTLVGVPYGREVVAPSGWTASTRGQSLQWVVGDCPAGRYCPAGTSTPVVCPAGTYSSELRRTEVCTAYCWQGFYCPDPGKRVPCPANTNSLARASSQLQCKCESGYQCTYRKQLRVNLALRVPYQVWVSPAGKALRDAVVQAVADSAGVPAGSVQVQSAIPSVLQSGGSRRLLGGAGQRTAVVSLSVEGGDRLERLEENLERRGGKLGSGARVAWKKIEQLRVLPEPARQSAWDWAGWLRRGKPAGG